VVEQSSAVCSRESRWLKRCKGTRFLFLGSCCSLESTFCYLRHGAPRTRWFTVCSVSCESGDNCSSAVHWYCSAARQSPIRTPLAIQKVAQPSLSQGLGRSRGIHLDEELGHHVQLITERVELFLFSIGSESSKKLKSNSRSRME